MGWSTRVFPPLSMAQAWRFGEPGGRTAARPRVFATRYRCQALFSSSPSLETSQGCAAS